MDLNYIGIMDDTVADGVCQGGVIQILMPARYIQLRTEDGGGCLCARFNQFQDISGLAFLERIQQPFIQNEQLWIFAPSSAFLAI